MVALSEQDQSVINAIFGRPQSKAAPVDLKLPPDQHVPLEKVQLLVEKEKEAIRLQEAGDSERALALLEEIISDEPEYASAYNNRAQMLRLKPEFDLDCVEQDLKRAIFLSQPQQSDLPVSKMQANVLRNAYLQLGLLYNQLSKEKTSNAKESWELQLQASEVLAMAGVYGEAIATSLAAHINPYAKLCGNMMEMVLPIALECEIEGDSPPLGLC